MEIHTAWIENNQSKSLYNVSSNVKQAIPALLLLSLVEVVVVVVVAVVVVVVVVGKKEVMIEIVQFGSNRTEQKLHSDLIQILFRLVPLL